jgi:hypothetical protein
LPSSCRSASSPPFSSPYWPAQDTDSQGFQHTGQDQPRETWVCCTHSSDTHS